MKNVKKIVLAVSLCAAMAATAAFGTLAYFTDTKDAYNTFTVGDLGITLTEPNWETEGKEDAKSIVPGDTVKKDPTITLETGSVSAYVGMVVTMPEELYKLTNFQLGDDAYVTFGTLGDGWKLAESTKVDSKAGFVSLLFVQQNVVASGATAALFENITFESTIGNDTLEKVAKNFNVDIKAYAVQSEGFRDVETALNDGFEEIVSK